MVFVSKIFLCLTVLTFACRFSHESPVKVSTGELESQTMSSDDEFALNKQPLKLPLAQPAIRIVKNTRRLMLYSGGELVRIYRIGLGSSPIEDKISEGDRRTPEGTFYVFTKNENSNYYLSLGLSYPNIEDAERGLREGLIDQKEHDAIVDAIHKKSAPPQNTALGGEIYIHGNGSQTDWTWGCIALENNEMRELFDTVPTGAEVSIEH